MCLVFQVRLVEVEGWLDGVQEMMSSDTAAFVAKENLAEELSQCKVRNETSIVDPFAAEPSVALTTFPLPSFPPRST